LVIFDGDPANDSGRRTSHHGVGRYISCHNGACRNDSPFSHSDAVGDDRPGSDPNIVTDPNSFSGDSLLDKGPAGIVKNVVYGQHLNHGGCVHTAPNFHTSLTPNDVAFANETPLADPNAGLREIAKVVDMQDRTVHHEATFSDVDSPGAGVEINRFIQVNTAAQSDETGKTETDSRLDSSDAVHLQDEPVGHCADGDADDCWDPPEQGADELFEYVASE